MGRRSFIMCLVLCVAAASMDNITLKHSGRRGKALKISKKPCTDPSGREGVCTFKWDCINHNGTLMGTCVDGFIFGTCCQYDNDPFLLDQKNGLTSELNSIKEVDDNRVILATTARPMTTRTTVRTTATRTTVRTTATRTTVRTSATTSERPFPSALSSLQRQKLTTVSPSSAAPVGSTTPSHQLVTWTSIGPTKRPIPQRPIILQPFPFRPGTNFPMMQGWPLGVAFPVDPFQINRPLQVFRPPVILQNAPTSIVSQGPVPSRNNVSYTILNGPDRTTEKTTSSSSPSTVEMTTISVPIPQWSTANPPSISAVIASSSFSSATTVSPLNVSNSNTSPVPQTASTIKTALDYRKDCGVRSLTPKARIVGGHSARLGRWPWQVLVKEAAWLGLYQKNKCGGVLVSSRYAITAGHCQPGRFLSALVVLLGEFDLLSDSGSMRTEMRRVKRMIVHRNYNPQNFDNDIALLELDPPVVFRPHISPICLPDPDEDYMGRMAYVTGWGKTSHGGSIPNLLQEVQVPIMSNAQCIDMFKEAGHAKLIKDTFLCAGYKTGGKDSCEGDSGGPLMVERSTGQWVLVGTVSHGIRCADPNLPGVYMRISSYRSWIDKIIQ